MPGPARILRNPRFVTQATSDSQVEVRVSDKAGFLVPPYDTEEKRARHWPPALPLRRRRMPRDTKRS